MTAAPVSTQSHLEGIVHLKPLFMTVGNYETKVKYEYDSDMCKA